MEQKTKQILFFSVLAVLISGTGAAVYVFVIKPKPPKDYVGKVAVAARNGVWVYNSNKSQAYIKKKGEWIASDFSDYDKEFYAATNTAGSLILFKKQDVIISSR